MSLVALRPAVWADIDWIHALQSRPANLPLVKNDPPERLAAMLSNPDAALLVAERGPEPIGFALLRGLESPGRSIELRRNIVDQPGQGLGGAFIRSLTDHVFEERDAHRFWLNVYEENERARRVYQREGFVEEGVMREAGVKNDGTRASVVVMAMLRGEWEAQRA